MEKDLFYSGRCWMHQPFKRHLDSRKILQYLKTPKKNHVTTEPWKVTEDKNGYIIAKTIVHAKPSMKRMLLRKASV
jgi:hypothetical protein